MCQKSSYERRCEDCNSRVIIHVVTHQVCNGKPPVSMTKAEKADRKQRGREIPYPKDGFICQRRVRPYKKYWSYVGSHACWHCSLRKQRNEAEEELETLLADKNRTETEVQLKRNRLKEVREQIMNTGVPEEDDMATLPKRVQVDMKGWLPGSLVEADESIWKSLEYLPKRSFEDDDQPDDSAESTDSPAPSDGEPCSLPVLDKGKGKAIATTEMVDVPSEATRTSPFLGASSATGSSPFLGVDRMGTQDTGSDVEMEDRERSEVQDTQQVDMSIARDLTLAALSRFYGWSERL